MIRLITTRKSNRKPVVFAGLEEENMTRLRDGKPILFNLRDYVPDHGEEMPDIEVMIFFADEKALDMLQQAYHKGVIDGMEQALGETDGG